VTLFAFHEVDTPINSDIYSRFGALTFVKGGFVFKICKMAGNRPALPFDMGENYREELVVSEASVQPRTPRIFDDKDL
jgi:hypothetical protein